MLHQDPRITNIARERIPIRIGGDIRLAILAHGTSKSFCHSFTISTFKELPGPEGLLSHEISERL